MRKKLEVLCAIAYLIAFMCGSSIFIGCIYLGRDALIIERRIHVRKTIDSISTINAARSSYYFQIPMEDINVKK